MGYGPNLFFPKIWVFNRIENRAYDNQEPKALNLFSVLSMIWSYHVLL